MSSTQATGRQHPTEAIVSLVLGIVGLTALPVLGSIIGLIFGYQSRRRVAEQPGVYTDDLGRIGRILGWIGVGLAIAGLLLVVVIIGVFAAV